MWKSTNDVLFLLNKLLTFYNHHLWWVLTKNWNSSHVFENTKILLHQRNFTQHHHQEKSCWYCFFFSQKTLFVNTGHLTSKLWMMFTVQICLKIIYRKLCIWNKWPKLLMTQWFLLQGNALPHNAGVTMKMPANINKHLYNTQPTVQTWPHVSFWSVHFLNTSRKNRNSAVTLKENNPLLLSCARYSISIAHVN